LIMPGLVRLYRRFIASTRGVVAIEFAAILPVLLIILLTTFDGGCAIAVYMKVRSATYVLASVTNQYSTALPIQSANMTGIMNATTTVLAPYSSTPLTAVISELKITATKATTATVRWSVAQNGTALGVGSSVSLPTGISASTNTCGTYPCYLILAQVSYTYTPLFGYFGSGITLSDTAYATPRSSTCVPYALQASPASPLC
jgi:Flp pilus assembly protein TadG